MFPAGFYETSIDDKIAMRFGFLNKLFHGNGERLISCDTNEGAIRILIISLFAELLFYEVFFLRANIPIVPQQESEGHNQISYFENTIISF